MEPLTYETYLANPQLRERLEKEARRARSEAVYQYLVMPLIALFRWPRSRPAQQLVVRSA